MRCPGVLLVAVSLVGLTGLSGCGSDALASSDFESSDDGWTMSGDVNPRPELQRSGGNPNGNICGRDLEMSDIWYFVAPGKYLGDMSKAYGRRLTWDLKGSSIYYQIKGREVVMQAPGLSIIFNAETTPGLDWTPYSVSLDTTSPWRLDTQDQPLATESDIKSVLSRMNALRLRGEFVDGPDYECLDNVYFGIK